MLGPRAGLPVRRVPATVCNASNSNYDSEDVQKKLNEALANTGSFIQVGGSVLCSSPSQSLTVPDCEADAHVLDTSDWHYALRLYDCSFGIISKHLREDFSS